MGVHRTEGAKNSADKRPGNLRVKGENFYRNAAQARRVKMLRGSKPIRNERGDILKAADLQSSDVPIARVAPNRKWFGNTRVISQDALEHFREAVTRVQKDSYQILLRRNKLPLSLLEEANRKPRLDITVPEPYADTFGPKAQRKKPREAVSSLESLANSVKEAEESFNNREEEEEAEYSTVAKDSVFSKGQSRRIWSELHKVVDSSDVVIHVLDARDPLGTRCRAIEQYLAKDCPHKHLIFVLNKCDLVPTWVTVSINRSKQGF